MRRKRPKQNTELTVKIECALMPDSDRRLSRAIDILLRSATKEPEGSINDKKAEPPQGSPLIEATETKDES